MENYIAKVLIITVSLWFCLQDFKLFYSFVEGHLLHVVFFYTNALHNMLCVGKKKGGCSALRKL